jgi:PIN domain nuclease of toxin-antitoxin system
MCASPERLSRKTQALLLDPRTERLLSVASIWELTIKFQLGKLPLPASPYDFVPSRLETTRTDTLPILASHALRVGLLPSHHRDPFDRMIIAQALVEGVPVLTADRAFRRYAIDRVAP